VDSSPPTVNVQIKYVYEENSPLRITQYDHLIRERLTQCLQLDALDAHVMLKVSLSHITESHSVVEW
jgi:hypothetical protein